LRIDSGSPSLAGFCILKATENPVFGRWCVRRPVSGAAARSEKLTSGGAHFYR